MPVLDSTMRTIRHLQVNLESGLAKCCLAFLFVKFKRWLLTAVTGFINNTLPLSDIMSNRIGII